MKKKILLIAIPLILLALIAGAYFMFGFSDSQSEISDVQVKSEADENNANHLTYTNETGIVPPEPLFTFTPFFDKLSDSEKELYLEMHSALFSYNSYTVDLLNSPYTEDDFINVFNVLCQDNPMLDLYTCLEFVSDDDYATATVYPTLSIIDNEYDDFDKDHLFDPELMNNYITDINAICDDIISRMPQDASLAEKYEFLGREICYITEYDHDDSPVSGRIDGVFLYGKSVCESYSKAYQYLCNRAGLWCIVTKGGGHGWNMVML